MTPSPPSAPPRPAWLTPLLLGAAVLSIVAGRIAEMPARLLVSGDLVERTAGGFVSADIRLVTAASLRIEEAALTGESEPVEKHVKAIAEDVLSLGDRLNMAFLGTVVTHGRGTGIVVATGMRTELGRIAGLLQTVPTTATPLQQRLDATGRHLAAAGAAAAAGVRPRRRAG